MTTKKYQIVKATLCVASLLTIACGDDGGGQGNEPDAASTFDASVTEFVCDPMGANPAVGALLNAPLESGIEVIVKTPTHPGDPGPTNLP